MSGRPGLFNQNIGDGRPSSGLLHEAAHVLTGHGHTPVWRSVMVAMGLEAAAVEYEQRYASSRRAAARRRESEL